MQLKKRPGRPAKPMPEPIPDTPENIRDILMRTPMRKSNARRAARSETNGMSSRNDDGSGGEGEVLA